MRSPVTFLQEVYLSSMTGNFNWIYDSVFPRNKPCWTFFLGIYGKLDVLYAGIVAENACAENKNRSVSCYAYFYFFIFYFLIRYNNFIYTCYFHQSFPFFQHQALGNNPTNSVVIPQSLMFEFCFHQWKYFFYILEGFLCSLTTDLLSIYQSRNFTMFTTQVSSVLGCRIFIIKTTTAAG